VNDVEEAPGPDPAAGDYLGEVIEPASSHGLEPLADDYAERPELIPYCAEHDMYRPCHWCPDELAADWQPTAADTDAMAGAVALVEERLGAEVLAEKPGWRPATPLGPPHGDVTPYGQPVGQLAAEIVSARVYCTKHHIARCTVCTGTSNAALVSRVAFRPEDAEISRTNQRLADRRAEFDAGVRYVYSLRLASYLLAGVLEELVWDYDAKLARIGRGDLS